MSTLTTTAIDKSGELANRGDQSTTTQMATTRASQEVQAAMFVAKQFPRDENSAFSRIMQACKRKTLAEDAIYAYPRGNETVSGPSIRLAEVLAQSWGNIDFGIVELEQKKGESQVMAYSWDLETNVRQTKIFTVKHERHTKRGVQILTDPRDIYELTANQGARRLRACILGVIPGDVVDAAVVECEKTMAGNNAEPLQDRVRQMVTVFNAMGITVAQIEKRVGKRTDAITEAELVNFKKIYKSLRDGMAQPGDFFDNSTPAADATTQTGDSKSGTLADQLAKQVEKSAESQQQSQDQPADATEPENVELPPEEDPDVVTYQPVDRFQSRANVATTAEQLDALATEAEGHPDEKTIRKLIDERRAAIAKFKGKQGLLPE